MANIFRYIGKSLETWNNSPNRKSLLVRGARQTGKSYAIRTWAATRFGADNVLELNFEERPQLKGIFKNDLVVDRILTDLQLTTGQNLREGKKLLFLDEIQACPEAIMALRYFYEKFPELPVIGAGSLIEFVLKEISFPVGRVENIFLYPLTFYEFLIALNKEHLSKHLETTALTQPLPEVVHTELLQYLKLYYKIGGMPEAVSTYMQTKDLTQVSKIHSQVLITYRDDFAKYAKKTDWSALNTVFRKLPHSVGQTRVKYSHLEPDLPAHKIKTALSLLSYAGLIYRIYSTNARALPLHVESREDFFKLLFVDIGLLQHSLGFDWTSVDASPDLTNLCDGRFAEQFVGQEIIASKNNQSPYRLHYWDRSQKGSNAEVDYIIEYKNSPAPLEIKSGVRGTLKSLTQYIKEYNPNNAFVLSQRNIEQMEDVMFLPLYYAARIATG